MKISRPTEGRVVVPFKDIDIGSHFELDGCLYIKRAGSAVYSNAVALQDCGCELTRVDLDAQCILVNVEFSYAYMSTEKGERND